MARVEHKTTYRVDIIESERGWGQKVDEIVYFDNAEEAIEYANAYNEKFNPPLKAGEGVPDWYMVARYAGAVR